MFRFGFPNFARCGSSRAAASLATALAFDVSCLPFYFRKEIEGLRGQPPSAGCAARPDLPHSLCYALGEPRKRAGARAAASAAASRTFSTKKEIEGPAGSP